MRKQLDPRIPALINNGVKSNHRSFFVMVGDKGRDQVVNLHFLLSQARVSSRPNVLWCYKKELGFTSHRKKREAKIKRDVKRGIREANDQDPFELFVTVTDIRYTYYKDSAKVLGQTFGMLVLQDYEAITPNLLARTIETVEGGGIVVLLLKTMTSLKQLYAMSMDVHSRYRTDAHQFVQPRFNERFILSLGNCADCLVLDDELNVLPLSKGKDIQIGKAGEEDDRGRKRKAEELKEMKESLEGVDIVGSLSKLAKTVDQAKALLTFVEAISEKTLSSTVALTAARGRGKSAALGLAIGAALAHDYSNIFVTSPDPENLKTLFEFVFKALDALGYEEHIDYDVVQSTNPDFKKAIVRVNIFRGHRQTIQYISPEDHHVLGQAELVIIDEAAAIPLPLVRKLIGPYLVFMASTINGYEGTGRSLSIKLIQQLREQTRPTITKDNDTTTGAGNGGSSKSASAGPSGAGLARSLREIKLDEPIRYSPGDNVEKWLNNLLCLDASIVSKSIQGCPHPSKCDLYYVGRDTLFSYHPASEVFLQRMMALYVASHYKNSPNDLQMLSDAPAHHLFVLLPPIDENDNTLPDPLCVLQVALEGNISRDAILKEMSQSGMRSSGDMIPWIVSQQYQDNDFATLSGARIVRIATHPDYARMGYGSRAIEALTSFYNGELYNFEDATNDSGESFADAAKVGPNASLQNDTIAIRDPTRMPPLLQRLSERKAEPLDYLGVSFGLTRDLMKFWKKAGFTPLYASQKENTLTGEYTFVMLKTLLGAGNGEWLGAFAQDFRQRFMNLLSFESFKKFEASQSLSILESTVPRNSPSPQPKPLTASELSTLLTPFDLKRLESYTDSMVDYHVVLDLVPTIANLFFARRLDVSLAPAQQAILLALGLQRKNVEALETELGLTATQTLALFGKILRKIAKALEDVQKEGIVSELPAESAPRGKQSFVALQQTVEQELADSVPRVNQGAETEEEKQSKKEQRELLDSLDMSEFAVNQGGDWSAAEKQVEKLAEGGNARLSNTVSVKFDKATDAEEKKGGKGKEAVKDGKKKKRDSLGDKGGKKKMRRE
ncbi:N-acetyltransferase 10 [Cryptococcus wingfieldii CBS 7118]|uniref:RNA cytidine acetyltransferase n=1 Tax=Cryptococcus wingfieldii CBS 7118 TaxID=1295528 RepID=A0A1E3IXW7_9TREE|nr:N-acetyltransferase 10 [Cryptococcus wingfieldii CBS 7118]ODN93460.1 N-acetyltransferase 10 [Cryptococcus wingfieldii CBS 7118]